MGELSKSGSNSLHQGWFGDVENGGYHDLALDYIAYYGVVTEAKLP